MEVEADADADLTGLKVAVWYVELVVGSGRQNGGSKTKPLVFPDYTPGTLFGRPSFRSTCTSVEFLSIVGRFARASAPEHLVRSSLPTPHSRSHSDGKGCLGH